MSRDTDLNFHNLPADGSGAPGAPRLYEHLDCDPRHFGLNPGDFDDLLKVSAKHDVVIRGFRAVSDGSHKEDGIDLMNECERVIFDGGVVQAGRKGVAITNKGGNRDCTFRHIIIQPPYGRFCDIEDGNHADQSQRKTTGTLYQSIRREDGKPVRYAWGRADRARFHDTPHRVVWWWTALLHAYVTLKRWIPAIP